MTPDPSRQWYVYFQDTELGPFSEADLLQKLAGKEFDDTAFVYTDGMANWEAVTGVEVLKKPTPPKPGAFGAPSGSTATLPVTPSMRLGTEAGLFESEPQDAESQFSENPQPDAEVSRMVDAGFETPEYVAPESDASNENPGEFLEAQPGESQGEPSIAIDTSDWGSDQASPDPIQMESVGAIGDFDLPPQIEETPPESPAIEGSGLPRGEFTEDLPGSRAGNFPEDEAHLSSAGNPVASSKSKTGIKAQRSFGRFVFRFALVIAVVIAVLVAAIKYTPLGKQALPTVQLISDITGLELVKALGLKGEESRSTPPKAAQNTDLNGAAQPGTPGVPAATVNNQDKIWTELTSFKAADNGAASPVRLANDTLMGNRPILVGVVSPMVMADRKLKKLRVAIFPDGERNLMVKPRVWIKEVPLYEDYFSIGPLTLDGQPLPPGAYQVMFRGDNTLMGSQVFQIGPWPSEPELSARMKELENQRAIAANEERKSLDQKFGALVQLTNDLEKNGREKGIQPGATARKGWLAFSQNWLKAYQAVGESLRPQGEYRFYADAHASLENYYKSLKHVYQLTEVYSNGGAKAFVKASKMARYTDLLIANAKQRDEVKGVLMDLEKQAVATPKINPDQVDKIKTILMGD